jgi:hypothetical protein
MRYLECSNYLLQRQIAAQYAAAKVTQQLGRPGFWTRVRAFFQGTSPLALQKAQIMAYTAEAQRFSKGGEGEQALLQRLGATLDGRYLLLRSLPAPGKHGDIDFLLLGPHGVTVYEVKSWSGTYWASDLQWLRLNKQMGVWQPSPYGNPTAQVMRNADGIRTFLYRAGLGGIAVYPVIVLGSTYMRVDPGQPHSVPIVHLFRRPPTTQALLGRDEAGDALLPAQVQELEAAFLGPTYMLLR